MNTANERERSDIEELLPWHAAGTLGRRDAQRVEAALADDPELARRYELVREELAQTIHLNETLGAPSARAMQALFAKIDAEPARRPTLSINLGARIAEFFANLSPRTLAWSGIAAAVAILLQAALITGIMLKEQSPDGYATASAPTSVTGEGAYVLIRFQPQASAADISQFLETNKLSIADGPSAGGLYRVRVAASKLPKTDLAGIVKTLRDDKVVGFIVMTE
jgi:anti-sigma factor RsiW